MAPRKKARVTQQAMQPNAGEWLAAASDQAVSSDDSESNASDDSDSESSKSESLKSNSGSNIDQSVVASGDVSIAALSVHDDQDQDLSAQEDQDEDQADPQLRQPDEESIPSFSQIERLAAEADLENAIVPSTPFPPLLLPSTPELNTRPCPVLLPMRVSTVENSASSNGRPNPPTLQQIKQLEEQLQPITLDLSCRWKIAQYDQEESARVKANMIETIESQTTQNGFVDVHLYANVDKIRQNNGFYAHKTEARLYLNHMDVLSRHAGAAMFAIDVKLGKQDEAINLDERRFPWIQQVRPVINNKSQHSSISFLMIDENGVTCMIDLSCAYDFEESRLQASIQDNLDQDDVDKILKQMIFQSSDQQTAMAHSMLHKDVCISPSNFMQTNHVSRSQIFFSCWFKAKSPSLSRFASCVRMNFSMANALAVDLKNWLVCVAGILESIQGTTPVFAIKYVCSCLTHVNAWSDHLFSLIQQNASLISFFVPEEIIDDASAITMLNVQELQLKMKTARFGSWSCKLKVYNPESYDFGLSQNDFTLASIDSCFNSLRDLQKQLVKSLAATIKLRCRQIDVNDATLNQHDNAKAYSLAIDTKQIADQIIPAIALYIKLDWRCNMSTDMEKLLINAQKIYFSGRQAFTRVFPTGYEWIKKQTDATVRRQKRQTCLLDGIAASGRFIDYINAFQEYGWDCERYFKYELHQMGLSKIQELGSMCAAQTAQWEAQFRKMQLAAHKDFAIVVGTDLESLYKDIANQQSPNFQFFKSNVANVLPDDEDFSIDAPDEDELANNGQQESHENANEEASEHSSNESQSISDESDDYISD